MVAIPITNVTELQAINGYAPGAEYYLANDIDASDTINWNAGAGFLPIAPADSGSLSFDGRKHKIKNLYINRPGTDCVALFYSPDGSLTVKDTILENAYIEGKGDVGGLVDYLFSGQIISGCSVSGSIVSNEYCAGGICGEVYGTIDKCSSKANVWNDSWGSLYGSLVGYNSGTITDCYATGSAEARFYLYQQVGGLAGRNDGMIRRCYSIGKVLPIQTTSYIINGFVGYNIGTILDSYWDIETSGYTKGTDSGSESLWGKTTSQMKRQSTFVGWDFDNTWGIVEDKTYPRLLIEPEDDEEIKQIMRSVMLRRKFSKIHDTFVILPGGVSTRRSGLG